MKLMEWLFGSKTGAPAALKSTLKSPEAEKVFALINSYVDSEGGIDKVVRRFEQAGFVATVRSWVSTGPNAPINSVEALQLVGLRRLSDMAAKAGVSSERLRDLLAELLPVAIDRATPLGRV